MCEILKFLKNSNVQTTRCERRQKCLHTYLLEQTNISLTKEKELIHWSEAE